MSAPASPDEQLYHLGFSPSHPAVQGTAYALIAGDPGRIEPFARRLDNPVFVASNREYTTWAGTLRGARVLVTSHGIGGPSTAICLEELYRCGVRTVIRAGTCGGMQPYVRGGDLVVATAAIRQDGTGSEYFPLSFPAAADFAVTQALCAAVHETATFAARNFPAAHTPAVHTGIVQCKDSFYGQHEPDSMPVGEELKAKWHIWQAGGCLASEMESATVFLVSAARGMRAGCVLHVVWNEQDAVLHTDTAALLDAAVGAMARLIDADRPAAGGHPS